MHCRCDCQQQPIQLTGFKSTRMQPTSRCNPARFQHCCKTARLCAIQSLLECPPSAHCCVTSSPTYFCLLKKQCEPPRPTCSLLSIISCCGNRPPRLLPDSSSTRKLPSISIPLMLPFNLFPASRSSCTCVRPVVMPGLLLAAVAACSSACTTVGDSAGRVASACVNVNVEAAAAVMMDCRAFMLA